MKGILNEFDDGDLIEKQRDKFHLKWVTSIRQEMKIAINITERFCWKLFEMIIICHNSCENGGPHFPLPFQNKYHY